MPALRSQSQTHDDAASIHAMESAAHPWLVAALMRSAHALTPRWMLDLSARTLAAPCAQQEPLLQHDEGC